jgi:hypothetical protein
MIILILALVVFQLTLLLVSALSIRRLAYSVLIVLGVGCLYEVIVSAQMPVDNNPIRIDLLFLTPFITSYVVFIVLGFLGGFLPDRSRLSLVRSLLFVCDCIITTVTARILL